MLLNNTDNASSLLESYDDLVNEDSRINRRRTRGNASFKGTMLKPVSFRPF